MIDFSNGSSIEEFAAKFQQEIQLNWLLFIVSNDWWVFQLIVSKFRNGNSIVKCYNYYSNAVNRKTQIIKAITKSSFCYSGISKIILYLKSLSEIITSDTLLDNMVDILELINSHTTSIIRISDDFNDPCRLLEEASAYILKASPDIRKGKPKTQFRIHSSIDACNNDKKIQKSTATLNDSFTIDQLAQAQKMFPKVPSELISLESDKNEMKRLSSAYELLQTEIDYVNDLSKF